MLLNYMKLDDLRKVRLLICERVGLVFVNSSGDKIIHYILLLKKCMFHS